MIKQVKFLKDYRCFKSGDTFDFNICNPLVGDQGCGKSTLLKLLSCHGKVSNDNVIEIVLENKEKVYNTYYLDFEHNSLRNGVGGYFSRDNDTFKSQVANKFKSHGQVVNNTLWSLNKFESGNIIFMDEPDMALSYRSIIHLANKLKDLESNKIQVIFSCHNPLLIEKMGYVLSLEEKKWVTCKDFFQHQSTINALKENKNVF